MKNPNDKRVVKTKKLIIDTFKEMIIEMEYEDITIKELAERANINRKTFYAHFECIEDILADFAKTIADKLLSNLEKVGVLKTPSIELFTEAVNITLNDNFQLYKKLIVAGSYRFITRNIKDIVKNAINQMDFTQTIDCTTDELDLCCEFVASGLAKIYKLWLENNNSISQQRIAELAGKMTFLGLNALVKTKDIAK